MKAGPPDCCKLRPHLSVPIHCKSPTPAWLRLERTTPEVVASDKAPRILSALLPATLFHLPQAVQLAGVGKMHGQGVHVRRGPFVIIRH